jgi:hypothetical protein
MKFYSYPDTSWKIVSDDETFDPQILQLISGEADIRTAAHH